MGTAFSATEWQRLANGKHGAYVLVEGGHVVDQGPYLKIAGEWTQAAAAGRSVRFESHTDYVMALTAQYALEAE
jgi:hypothetical protein